MKPPTSATRPAPQMDVSSTMPQTDSMNGGPFAARTRVSHLLEHSAQVNSEKGAVNVAHWCSWTTWTQWSCGGPGWTAGTPLGIDSCRTPASACHRRRTPTRSRTAGSATAHRRCTWPNRSTSCSRRSTCLLLRARHANLLSNRHYASILTHW